MGKDVIIACDFKDRRECLDFLSVFKDEKPFLKLGMELYYREGAAMLAELKQAGFKVFLDLKLHDIPNTVYKAMRNLSALGADIINCHAAGGIEMMRAAVRGAKEGNPENPPVLIAVTQLTSIDADTLKNELLIEKPLRETVYHYAKNAKEAGLSGIVCSPHEADIAKDLGLLSVTPGIRLEGDAVGDQKRFTTPAMAKEMQSAYIVVGRSITDAADPVAAYKQCCRDFLD